MTLKPVRTPFSEGQDPIIHINLKGGIPRKPCYGKQRRTIGDIRTKGAEHRAIDPGAVQQDVPVCGPRGDGKAKSTSSKRLRLNWYEGRKKRNGKRGP